MPGIRFVRSADGKNKFPQNKLQSHSELAFSQARSMSQNKFYTVSLSLAFALCLFASCRAHNYMQILCYERDTLNFAEQGMKRTFCDCVASTQNPVSIIVQGSGYIEMHRIASSILTSQQKSPNHCHPNNFHSLAENLKQIITCDASFLSGTQILNKN